MCVGDKYPVDIMTVPASKFSLSLERPQEQELRLGVEAVCVVAGPGGFTAQVGLGWRGDIISGNMATPLAGTDKFGRHF